MLNIFRAFREAASGVLFCTDVAARGLDLPQVIKSSLFRTIFNNNSKAVTGISLIVGLFPSWLSFSGWLDIAVQCTHHQRWLCSPSRPNRANRHEGIGFAFRLAQRGRIHSRPRSTQSSLGWTDNWARVAETIQEFGFHVEEVTHNGRGCNQPPGN